MAIPEYDQLPLMASFQDILDSSVYNPAPRSWLVVVTDVRNSTEAVQQGLYKEVNMAGAAAISVVSNIVGSLNFPFSFGGDGASMLLPRDTALQSAGALQQLQTTIQTVFGLDLRVGCISVQELTDLGHPVGLARLRSSQDFAQAAFSGSGLRYAEELLKAGSLKVPAAVPYSKVADMRGFSCRWRDIPSKRGETFTLIVLPLSDQPIARLKTLNLVYATVGRVLGEETNYHPVGAGNQEMVKTTAELNREARIMSGAKKGFKVFLYRQHLRIQNMFTRMVIRLNIPVLYYRKYLNQAEADNILHADFRKFDGELKMVLACSPEQRVQLQQQLEVLESDGTILFGAHVSDRSVITCFIQTAAKQDIHFIDGGDGGYTMAAWKLKQKKRRNTSVQ